MLISSKHSLVLVASNHAVWDPERARKPRRKYGRLVKSPFNDLNNMLSQHKEQVTKILFEQIHDWLEQYKFDLAETARSKAPTTATANEENMSGGSGGESGSSNGSNKYGNNRSNKRLRQDSAPKLKPSPRNRHDHQQQHPRHSSVHHHPRSSPSRSLPTSPSSKRGITSSTSTSYSKLASTITSPSIQSSSNPRLLPSDSRMSPDTKTVATEYRSIKLEKHNNSPTKTMAGNDSGSRIIDVQQQSKTMTTSATTTTESSVSPFGASLIAPDPPKPRPEVGKLER